MAITRTVTVSFSNALSSSNFKEKENKHQRTTINSNDTAVNQIFTNDFLDTNRNHEEEPITVMLRYDSVFFEEN